MKIARRKVLGLGGIIGTGVAMPSLFRARIDTASAANMAVPPVIVPGVGAAANPMVAALVGTERFPILTDPVVDVVNAYITADALATSIGVVAPDPIALAAHAAFTSRFASHGDPAIVNHAMSNGDEPGPMVVWSADDGYTTQVDYFALLSAKGVHGTLFLTKNWVDRAGVNPTWGDTYVTSTQVRAIVAAGHEIGSHGLNHESVPTFFTTNGATGLDAMEQGNVDYIQSTFGVTVQTGAYPGGASTRRTREIVARSHQFFRGTKGAVAVNGNDPYDVPAIDVYTLSEAAIKAHVDTALANNCLCVFLVHGGLTSAHLTKVSNVIDYCVSLGVPMDTFYNAMLARTSFKGSAGAMIDTSGHARFTTMRTNRIEVTRNDELTDTAYFDMDETINSPYFDSAQATTWEFRKPVRFRDTLSVGKRTVFADGVLNNTTTVTSAAARFDNYDIGITVTGTGIPAGATIVAIKSGTSVQISTPATATATGVTITLGRPVTPSLAVAGNATFHGSLDMKKAGTSAQIRFYRLESTPEGSISAASWSRSGAGGSMAIDSGTGGSNIDIKGARVRMISHTGARKIAFAPSAPSDASIDPGEVVMYFDSTNGAAKVKFRGKSANGTVVNGELTLR